MGAIVSVIVFIFLIIGLSDIETQYGVGTAAMVAISLVVYGYTHGV